MVCYRFISEVDSKYFTKNKIYKVLGYDEKSHPIVKGDTGRIHQVVLYAYGWKHWERADIEAFDITKHELSYITANDIHVESYEEESVLSIDIEEDRYFDVRHFNIWINKKDAIAIAKALGVTGDDL